MSYQVQFSGRAARDYRKLDRPTQAQIRAALRRLAEDPILGKQLQGPLRHQRSYRVGDYRILYRIEHERLIALVLTIRHRRDVYRR